MVSFLLVHGACHGAWCWNRLVPHLRASGSEVAAIDLPGHGTNGSQPSPVKLQDSVTAIREEIARFAQPPVLVGHSWGGFPVTIAAAENPAAVAGMAYLAAYLPVDGESFREARSPEVSPEREGAVEIEGASLSLRRERAIPLLYHDVPEPWAKEATARLEPEWRGPQAEVVRLARTNWRELPKLYVRTEYDRMIPPGWQDRMAARAEPVSVESLRSGHSPFLSLPAELAAVLLRFFK